MLARPGLTRSQVGRTDAELNTLIATSGRTDAEVNTLIANHQNVRTVNEVNTLIANHANVRTDTEVDNRIASHTKWDTKQKAFTLNDTGPHGNGSLSFSTLANGNLELQFQSADFTGLQPTITISELQPNSTYPGGRLHKPTTQTGGGEVLEFTPATIPPAVDTSTFATTSDLAGKANLSGATFTGGVTFNSQYGANVATNGHLTVNGASNNLTSDLRVYGRGQYDRGRLTFTNINVNPWAENYQHWDGGTFKIRNKAAFASGTGNTVNTYPMYQGNQWKASIGVYRGNNNRSDAALILLEHILILH